jgi:putative spermidine/putrescine transport system permease protein
MVALIESPAGPRPADASAEELTRAPRRKLRVWRGVVLGIAAVYFLLPLYAALKFALTKTGGGFSFSAFSSIPSQLGFSAAFELSLRLALVTTVITLVLMVPTAVFVHLRYPNLRRLFDGITILPIVIPPVVLIVGVLEVAPTFLKSTPYLLALEYVVLAMPFAYRSLDAGLNALDLKTLVEAGRSLGSRSLSTLLRVVVPNLSSAILSATVLTVALVLGEYTMATLDQYQTFSVWIVYFDADNAQVSVAASIMALLVTWALLMVIRSLDLRRTRRSFQPKGAS